MCVCWGGFTFLSYVVFPADGLNLISACMFSLICPHTEQPARHYHAGKHWLSLDYVNGEAHTNINFERY